jgi:hypothetical protein
MFAKSRFIVVGVVAPVLDAVDRDRGPGAVEQLAVGAERQRAVADDQALVGVVAD